MRLPTWLQAKAARRAVRVVLQKVRARFDNAQTTDDNRKHWGAADGLSAAAAHTPAIRALLRNRSRYETVNNGYACGMVRSLANETIGTGVRLQMQTGDPSVDGKIEEEFTIWMKGINGAAKLRTMRATKIRDGEIFGLITNNPALPTKVKADLKLLEGDQIQNPWDARTALSMSDGIEYDAAGNATFYHVLKTHPGDLFTLGAFESSREPAKNVIHYFDAERAGQMRGIPEITASLGIFAQLRRYGQAVLSAAEAAADNAMLMKTAAPPDGAAEVKGEPFTPIELERGMMTVLPEGWDAQMMKAEQPTTTYKEFKNENLGEAGRPLQMPRNVILGDSSGYNYASGRLDHQVFFKAIRIERSVIECLILDRLLATFLQEAILIDGYLPMPARKIGASSKHQWFWDGEEHVDPMKEANAQGERLMNHTTTLAAEYGRQGKDWELELAQRGKEVELMRKLGLEIPSKRAPDPQPADPEGAGSEA